MNPLQDCERGRQRKKQRRGELQRRAWALFQEGVPRCLIAERLNVSVGTASQLIREMQRARA